MRILRLICIMVIGVILMAFSIRAGEVKLKDSPNVKDKTTAQTPAAPLTKQGKTEAWRLPKHAAHCEMKLLDKEGAGKLYQIGDQLLCILEGTPEEIGFQHGRLLAKKVLHVAKEGYLKHALYDKGYTLEILNERAVRMEKFIPEEYIAEIKAIIRGCEAAGVSGVKYEELRAGQMATEMAFYKPGEWPKMCTTWAMWGRWTPDGRQLIARNTDWELETGASDDAVNMIIRPKGRKAFFAPSFAGCVGAVLGINNAGIFVSSNSSTTCDESYDGIPYAILQRLALEKASTLDEAVAIIRDAKRTIGVNYLISDAKIPDARALEADATDCEIFGPMDKKENKSTLSTPMPDCVRRTNHPCGDKHFKKMIARMGKAYGVTPENYRLAMPLLMGQDSWIRYDWLRRKMSEREGKMDPQACLELLCNGQVYGTDTLQSCVFDPKHNLVWVAEAQFTPKEVTAMDREYTKIDLAPWFK
ncbi:MAG TPA: C45 family autoproteolytic acyltransferase/hydrolase [Candidatus Brocadiia bacterium]|nr:C45 family autoproteolytic acyltransferase/hydrolase [Candidatus Brocadiia bacterium]